MNHYNHPHVQAAKPIGASVPAEGLNRIEAEMFPAPEEMTRRAYLKFESEGSVHGYHVQPWLAAETELIAEQKASPAARL